MPESSGSVGNGDEEAYITVLISKKCSKANVADFCARFHTDWCKSAGLGPANL